MKKANRLWGMLLAVVLAAGALQGTAFAAQQKAGAKTEAAKVFDAKVKEIEKKNGVLKEGDSVVKAEPRDFYTSTECPFEEKSDCGVLFTDVRDYDKDGAQELLSLQRVRNKATLQYEGEDLETEKYDYIFEMYEASGGNCSLAASKTIGVFDVLNWSIYCKNISVFLHETDKAVDICTETYISQQDHPSDTALVLFRYDGKTFSDGDGIRFGDWYQEQGVRCMKPSTSEALGYLSDLFPTEEESWMDIASCDLPTDEKYLVARNDRLKALGFSSIRTRSEIMDSEKSEDEQAVDEVSVEEPGEEEIELEDSEVDAKTAQLCGLSALECYSTETGTLTMLLFVSEYVKTEMDEDGMIQIERSVNKEKKTAEQEKKTAEEGKKTAEEGKKTQ